MIDRIDGNKLLRLSDIEKGLSALWAKAASGAPKTEGPAELKVCTLSMVVMVEDEAGLDTAFEAIRIASQDHPLRSVYIRIEPEAPATTPEGQVSGYCQITPAGNVQVCCEQVVVTAKGKAVDELAPAVTNLLVPDLPVVLWWMSQPAFGVPLFERLESVSDYLLVDSRDFSDPAIQIRKLAENAEKHPLVAPSDLNWLRIIDWREATAELFENPELRPSLDELSNVEIRYSSGSPAQAILFAGWLGGRLKWTSEGIRGDASAGKLQCAAKSARGDEILIALEQEENAQARAGNLLSITLEAQSERHSFSLTCTDKEIRVQALHDAKVLEETTHSLEFPFCTLPQLLAHELIALWPDPIYHEALLAGAQLLSVE